MNSTKVTLLLPGYGVADQFDGQLALPESRFQVTRGNKSAPWQEQLCQSLGLAVQASNRLPCLLQEKSDSTLVHADPVHLKADRDTATLIPPQALGLNDECADELIDALNTFVESDGLEFYRQSAESWSMSGMPTEALQAYPTSFLAYRKASAFLPEGNEAKDWQRLMSEIQMLFHTHPINQEREQNGQLTVNSLWFWGGANLPDSAVQTGRQSVYSDEPYANALCDHLRAECNPLAAFNGQGGSWSSNDGVPHNVIIIDTSMIESISNPDEQAFEKLTNKIDEHYLRPLGELVARGRLSEAQFLTEDGFAGICSGSSAWWRRLFGWRL